VGVGFPSDTGAGRPRRWRRRAGRSTRSATGLIHGQIDGRRQHLYAGARCERGSAPV